MVYLETLPRVLSPPPLLTLGAQLTIPFLGSRKSGWPHWGHIPVLETTLWVPHGVREEEFLKGKLRICYQKKGNWLMVMETLVSATDTELTSRADEWIRKLWYIYTMEYYWAIKKNTFESVLMRWMKLEPIIQSEVSQKEKHQYSILTHIYGI